jgi:hypothetical protein
VPVSFYVLNCPAGTVVTDDLSTKCTTPAAGITFTVANETETLTTGTTDSGGTVQFSDVPTGEWGFIETLPAGFGEPLVFCNGTFGEGPVDYREEQVDVLFGNQARLFLREGPGGLAESYVDCTWANIPAAGADNGPQIFIQARRCVIDLNMPDNANLADAEALCPEELSGKSFTVDVNGEEIEYDTSLDNGQVFFTKLPAPNGGGMYGITVSLGNREQVLAVFCDNNFGADVFHAVTTTVTNGNRIDQEMYEGQTMRCSWFIAAYPPVNPNITPVPGASTDYLVIQIYNRECPATVDMSAPSTDLCPQDVTGVAFDITWNGELRETQTNSGTNGLLLFQPGGMTGSYLFTPRSVEGYGDLRYSCEFAQANGAAASTGILTTGAPGIPIEFDGTGGVLCVVYYQAASDQFVQEVDPGVILMARLCNPGADLTQGDVDTACPTAAAGIAFSVDMSGESYVDTTTNTEGVIDLPLPVGDATFSITPQAPAGYGLPGYLCSIIRPDGAGGGKVVRLTTDVPSHDLAWSSDSETTCTYYFPVVAEDQAADEENAGEDSEIPVRNNLTIQFWICPTGVDPAADQADLLFSCSNDPESHSLTVTIDGEVTEQTVTGNAIWEYDSPDFTADIGDGFTSSVWCSSSWLDDGETNSDFPETVALEGGALTLTAGHSATTSYCDWFIFTP